MGVTFGKTWVAAVLIAAVLCAQAMAGEKYALLCGCVEYDNGPNLKPNDLPTTLYDIVAMYEMLTTKYGFKPENIRVLLSPPESWPLKPAPYGPATITNIAKSFASWFAKAGPDDVIFFGYSGHGTYLNYTSGGVEVHDEAILGSDYAWIEPPQVLTFSQIRYMHSRLHDGQAVFLIDACHSGGGVLALHAVPSLYKPPPIRFSPADSDTRPVKLVVAGGMAPKISAAQMDAIRKRTTTITACQAWEVASGAGPELKLLGRKEQTGVMTGEVVRAVMDGPANQSWEDVGRTARLLSQLDCIEQTVGVYGEGLRAMPFTQPPVAPTPPPYYVTEPEGNALSVRVDPFLGAGSVLEVYKNAAPEGAAADAEAKLERVADSPTARLVGKVEATGPKAAVAKAEDVALPKLGIYAVAADRLGAEDAGLTKRLRDSLAGVEYARLCGSANDPRTDYKLWVSVDDEDTTWPFALARSGEFPSPSVAGRPMARSFEKSTAWLKGLLHYLRAVEGAAWARNRGSRFRVWITPDKERPLYLPGEPVKLRLEANAECEVVVVAADSAGNATVLPVQEVGPEQAAEVSFTPPAGGMMHDMRLVVVKALAFRKKPSDAAVAKLASEAKVDPAKAMLGLVGEVLGTQGGENVPTAGWADNEAFVTVWDRKPLTEDLVF